jgi:hypothetical protein
MAAATMQPTTVIDAEFATEQCTDGQDGGQPNAVYLFACHVRWNNYADLKAYRVPITALDSNDEEVRKVAEALLRRKSPRPKSCSKYSEKANAVQERQQCQS